MIIATEKTTTKVARIWIKFNDSPKKTHARKEETTGTKRVKVDPTQRGIRTSDQFIRECPIKPATVAKTMIQKISLLEGIVNEMPKIKAIPKFSTPVITPDAAVNSKGVTRSWVFFETTK